MKSHIFLTFRLICFETKRILKKCYVFFKHSVLYTLVYTASVKWLATRFATAGIRFIAAARTCKILHEVQTGSGDNLAPVQGMLGNICLGMMPLEREADYSQSRDV